MGRSPSSPLWILPTFTFRQVGLKTIEFQALPGPEAMALRGKTMRHASFLGPGGQVVLCPETGLCRCRGARPAARAARPILRKQSRISGQNSFPADAFSAQRPCFRATSLLLIRQNSHKSERWANLMDFFSSCFDQDSLGPLRQISIDRFPAGGVKCA